MTQADGRRPTADRRQLNSATPSAQFYRAANFPIDFHSLTLTLSLQGWNGSAFSLWFDGQDVGLTNFTKEKIDALHVLNGTDVLGFCMTNSGANTAGFWHRLLNGKAEGMPGQALVNLSASDDGQVLYLTTKAAFNVDSAHGGHSMVYRYDLATTQFSGPFFSAPAEGLNRQVDGLHVDGKLP